MASSRDWFLKTPGNPKAWSTGTREKVLRDARALLNNTSIVIVISDSPFEAGREYIEIVREGEHSFSVESKGNWVGAPVDPSQAEKVRRVINS